MSDLTITGITFDKLAYQTGETVKATLNLTDKLGTATESLTALFKLMPKPPVFGMNYDVDGGLDAAAATLGCKPFTAAKVFNSSMPASYPGHQIPASVTHPLATIKVKLTTTAPYLSPDDQTSLACVFASMPKTGVPMVTIDQEGEAGRFGYTAAQVVGAHAKAYEIFKANAPANAVYCQDFETYDVVAKKAYVCCPANGGVKLPLYLLDWYPQSTTSDAVSSIQPDYDTLKSLLPDAVIGVAECNYTTSLSSGITWQGSQAQWFADAWQWAKDHNIPLFMTYFLTAHGVPWPPAQATLDGLSAIAHDSGL